MAQLQESTVGGSLMLHAGNYGRVIDRGNPGSGSPLTLSSFDVIHYYSGSGISSIDVSTVMVENAVYEVHVTTGSSAENIDLFLQPNYTTYGSEFVSMYWSSEATGAPNKVERNEPTSFFYFDHFNGVTGNTPVSFWTLFNFRDRKQVMYLGGDTTSIAMGTSRWNNNTTQWQTVGRFNGYQSSNDFKLYVRRVG
jgi:hypothetical protein